MLLIYEGILTVPQVAAMSESHYQVYADVFKILFWPTFANRAGQRLTAAACAML